jgi:hypothetical protein
VAQCQCEKHQILTGRNAEQYAKEWLRYVTDKQGWLQLWQCHDCTSYWEMTWEGGKGFDDGVMTLRRLSLSEVRERWPQLEA